MHPMFAILFDQDESLCLADDPKGTRVWPASAYNQRLHAFFSINPLDPKVDHAPTAAYHSATKPRRADANVVTFRNILLEMDQGTLDEQYARMQKSGLPYSTCVYSGGKSLHFIISLAEPVANRAQYDALVRRIYAPFAGSVDAACKNPSRLSRSPDHLRRETFKFQSPRDIKDRVSPAALEGWLAENEAASREVKSPGLTPGRPSPYLRRSTEEFLQAGAPDGLWNIQLFKSACDAFGKGWTLDQFIQKAEGITGHLDTSDHLTIRSAWHRRLS